MDILLFVFLFWVTLNILVSIFIARRADLDSFQKGAQVTMVWLIPFIAAVGLWLFHRSIDDKRRGVGPIGGGPNDSIGGM